MISNPRPHLRDFQFGGWLFGTVFLALACMATALAAVVTYEYDDVSRLKKATYGDGSVTIYTLDAAGNLTNVMTGATGGHTTSWHAPVSGAGVTAVEVRR